jgi:hypothetical protein
MPKKRLPNNGFQIRKIPGFVAVVLSVVLISSCSTFWKESPTVETLPPTAGSNPASPEAFSEVQPDNEISYTVVGIPPDQTLQLYLEPSTDSQTLFSLPSAARSIHPLKVDQDQSGVNWLAVDYQGQQGWAQKSYLALQRGNLPGELAALSQAVAGALKEMDYGALIDLIDPQLCLRFSPYQYLNETDQVICPGELDSLEGSDAIRIWGNYDGSGEPIRLTFQEYHERFVYDEDYYQPQVVGFNQEVSQGNSLNNIADIYPDGIMVEYYFPGFDPQYGGMDWRSLRLVFVNLDGQWYLAALVHGEWTI